MRLIVIASVAALAAMPATAQLPSGQACRQAERSQFDFWVGHWDVYPTGAIKIIAHSVIEKLYAGCAIRENWMPLGGTGGGSLSAWDPKTGKWRQTWVDSSGTTVHFEGGFANDTMTIEGLWANVIAPGKDGVVRMNYRRNRDGSVRQWGEVTQDGGRTWTTSFDFTYRKSP